MSDTSPSDSERQRAPARRWPLALAAAASVLLWLAPGSPAQKSHAEHLPATVDTTTRDTSTVDSTTREVVGLRVGSWRVTDVNRLREASYSTIPVADFFYRRELGDRTALELGLSLWRRGRATRDGTVGMWVGPLYGGLKYYPFGRDEAPVEPYLSAAAGPALGYEQRESSRLGSLVSGWTVSIGPGAEAGAGAEMDLSRNLGLTLDAGYQWVHYLAGELDSPDTYRGAAVSAGVTYRLNLR